MCLSRLKHLVVGCPKKFAVLRVGSCGSVLPQKLKLCRGWSKNLETKHTLLTCFNGIALLHDKLIFSLEYHP